MKSPLIITVLSVCCGWATPGCAHFMPPVDDESTDQTSRSCEELAMIEDADDGDDQTLVRAGRGGYLYTYIDAQGTTIEPPTNSFSATKGGVNGDGYALRIQGTVADADDVYAGAGFSFTEPKALYDASRYRGISFVAKKGPDSTASVRLKVPDGNTDPDGGKCTECYNDFGISFQISDEWTRYEVRFADLKQEHGWGDPRPGSIAAEQLYGIQLQVTERGARFDIWVDDITFIGCTESPSEVQ